jgi:ABC-type multidrug transport system ATPase subunit
MIEFQNVSYRYPHGGDYVLKDASFYIPNSGFHGIFGPSGVGKTTLASIICGEIQTFTGKLIHASSLNIYYSYNTERIPGWSNVWQHLQEVTPKHHLGRLPELIAAFGLQACRQSRFAQLSLGQKNRVNLVRYLLQDFDILIMDESLANVDEATREKIILKIKALYPDKSFLYISHNLVEVSKFCQQIFVLRSLPKKPQIISLTGQDHQTASSPDPGRLEAAMLEIFHAL